MGIVILIVLILAASVGVAYLIVIPQSVIDAEKDPEARRIMERWNMGPSEPRCDCKRRRYSDGYTSDTGPL